MAKQLKVTVHVDGTRYDPGQRIPAEVAEKITNPDVWADPAPTEEDQADNTPPPAPVVAPDANRPAANATRTAWVKYAESLGVPVTGEMKPADIAAAIDKAAADKATAEKAQQGA